MQNWTLLTGHARVLLAIARDPGIRLRDIADSLGITERSACAIVTDLTEAGYVAKRKHGRRNCYQVRAHLPLPGPASQHATIGELLNLFTSQPEATERSTRQVPRQADMRPPARRALAVPPSAQVEYGGGVALDRGSWHVSMAV